MGCGGRSGVPLSAHALAARGAACTECRLCGRLERSPRGAPRSARRGAWGAIGVALVIALSWPAVARAVDVKVWPLFRYARDDERGLLHWSALGPLVEFSNTPETRDLRIRPVLWLHQRRGATRDDRTEFLYPLASSRWRDDYQSFRFLLFTYRTSPRAGAARPEGRPPPIEQWTSRLTVLPFVL